jgi:putative ABC transport system ATP-binding protein
VQKELIRCKNVWKIYNEGMSAEVEALQDINLEIGKGEFTSIMGASGSGKSTLMHCIGCLDKPTRGKIYFEGQDLSSLSDNELAAIRRRKIGFVFQFFNLVPSLTALENVELPMVFNGVEEGERKKRAAMLLEEVGLGDRMGHRQAELSGGERQRVALARALTNNPSLILADEPTGNLDSRSGEEVLNILKRLNKEGKTVVIITHDSTIARSTPRAIKLKDGMVVR